MIRSNLLVAMLSLLMTQCYATVTVVETNHRYASRQEADIGRRLWHGYVYQARLQYIDANPWLCNDDNEDIGNVTHYNITAPPDGIPVALLVRGGSCSLEEKARFVMDRVFPKGLVRFLIIGSGRKATENAEQIGTDIKQADIIHVPTAWDDVWDANPLTRRNNHYNDRNEIPLSLLHVSLRTAEELLIDVIRMQKPQDEKMGGPRVDLDARLGTGVFDSDAAVWVALSALLSACACSAILIASGNRAGWWEPDIPDHPLPTRPQRRRLTREEVRERFPRYRYTEHGTLQPVLEAMDVEVGQDGLARPDCRHIPEPNELDLCSICLDEYEVGDKLRCLPCNHAFHARCIGKWLSERSATCPLCKDELHIDEDDESSSDESAQEAEALVTTDGQQQHAGQRVNWWDRLHIFARRPETATAANDQTLLENEGGQEVSILEPSGDDNVTPDAQPSADLTDFPRPSFWRRIFPNGNRGTHSSDSGAQSMPAVEQSPLDMLAEPLLHPNSSQEDRADGPIDEEANGSAQEEERSALQIPGPPAEESLGTRQVTI